MTTILPAVSVLMPVYNAKKYIKAAVESIITQEFTSFEFIIINDGSTDGTLKILEAYAKKDHRIRLISRENKGLIASLNEGLDLAQAPLIARMDADDIALETRLSEQVAYLADHSDVVCVGSFFEIIDEKNRGLTILEAPTVNADIQQELIKGHSVICHPSAIMRKDAVLKVGKYREKYHPAEDLDLWLRLGEVGLLSNIPKTLMKYRVLNSSISGIAGEKQLATARKVIGSACERRRVVSTFEPTIHFRPDETIESKYDFILKYGWWAFNYKNKTAAIVYGIKAVKICPLNKKSWQLLYCAIFKMIKQKKSIDVTKRFE